MLRRSRDLTVMISLTVSAACRILPATSPHRVDITFVASPVIAGMTITASDTGAIDAEGALIVLDTVALRPVLWRRAGAGLGDNSTDSETANGIQFPGAATFSTYRGSRYHPDALRAITEDSLVLRGFADDLAREAQSAGSTIFLDIQDAAAGDIPRIVAFTRAVSAALPPQHQVGLVVPAGDTLRYPAPLLARVAALIVVRLAGEHGVGTAPGAPVTPDFVRRQLGTRSIGIGATRLAAEFPLFGMMWEGNGAARPITYSAARTLVVQEAGVFGRDPASRYLFASGRDGWSVWVPDLETVRTFIAAAADRGITRIVLSGRTGSDPAIAQPGALTR